jgi:hypothetical protein
MFTKQILILLKLATVISYCCIIILGEIIGGPMGVFILLGFFTYNLLETLFSVIFTGIIFTMIFSAFRPKRKRDLVIFILGGIILQMPLIWLLIDSTYLDLEYFFWTAGFFTVIWITTITGIYNNRLE